MRRFFLGLVLAVMVSTLSSCGDDEAPPRTEPVTSFDSYPRGSLVFEAFDQTGGLTKAVTMPEGTRGVLVRIDCVGDSGKVDVTFSSFGAAGGNCTTSSKSRPPSIGLSGDGALMDREQKITITAPGKQKWSVAVYARDDNGN